MNKTRCSNFELLRVLSMFFIVAHHYSVHGAWNFHSGFYMNKFYVQLLSIGGKVGVDVFVLISAFFLSGRPQTLLGALKIIPQVWFYSIVIMLIFYFTKGASLKDVVTSLIPIDYWFVNVFILMGLCSPLINKAIDNIDRKNHLTFIIVTTILLNIPAISVLIGKLGLFVYLYLISFYIRKHMMHVKVSNLLLLSLIFISGLMIAISIGILDHIHPRVTTLKNPLYFASEYSIFVLVISVSLLILFKGFNIKNSVIVNTISGSMLGVYLIHDNQFMRPYIWEVLLNVNSSINSDGIYLISIISISGVFIACILIELSRKVLSRFTFKLIKRMTFINSL